MALGAIATIGYEVAQETGLLDFGGSPNVSDSDKFVRATTGQSICPGKYKASEVYARAAVLSPADKQDLITQISGLKKYLAGSTMSLGQAINAVVFLANGGSDCNDNTAANVEARAICSRLMGINTGDYYGAVPESYDSPTTSSAYGEAYGEGGKVSANVWDSIKDSFLGTLEQNLQNLANQAAAGAAATEAAAASATASSQRQGFFASLDITTYLLVGLAAVVAYFAFLK